MRFFLKTSVVQCLLIPTSIELVKLTSRGNRKLFDSSHTFLVWFGYCFLTPKHFCYPQYWAISIRDGNGGIGVLDLVKPDGSF